MTRSQGGDTPPAGPIETVRFARPAALPVVEIMTVENTQRLYEAMPDHHTFAVATAGGALSRYRGAVHTCRPGAFAMFEPGEIFRCTDVDCFSFHSIVIEDATLVEAAHELDLPGRAVRFARACVEDPELSGRLRELCLAVTRSATPLAQQSLYAGCIASIVRTYGDASPRRLPGAREPVMVRRALELLHTAPEQPITLDDLAQASGANKFTLLRAFQKRVGVPPHRYQLHLRIRRARELLRSGKGAAEVAMALGFYDQSHFISWFKRLTLVTPAAYSAGLDAPVGAARR